jgi:hypothetical protein
MPAIVGASALFPEPAVSARPSRTAPLDELPAPGYPTPAPPAGAFAALLAGALTPAPPLQAELPPDAVALPMVAAGDLTAADVAGSRSADDTDETARADEHAADAGARGDTPVAGVDVPVAVPAPAPTPAPTVAVESPAAAATPAVESARAARARASVTRPTRDLGVVAPELRERLGRVVDRMRDEFGHSVEVVESGRSQARQDHLYAQGRSRPGPVVTWTRHSEHTRGRAVDVTVDGGYDDAAAFRLLQRVAREEGLHTLGMRDPGHLQLPADVAGEGAAALLDRALLGDATAPAEGSWRATVESAGVAWDDAAPALRPAPAAPAHGGVAAVATVATVAPSPPSPRWPRSRSLGPRSPPRPSRRRPPARAPARRPARPRGRAPPAPTPPRAPLRRPPARPRARPSTRRPTRRPRASAPTAGPTSATPGTTARPTTPGPAARARDAPRPSRACRPPRPTAPTPRRSRRPRGRRPGRTPRPPRRRCRSARSPRSGWPTCSPRRSAAAPRQLSHLTLRLENAAGGEDRIRVDLRSGAGLAAEVGARIDVADAGEAGRLAARAGELRDALARHGLSADAVRVGAAGGAASGAGNPGAAGSSSHQPPPDHGRGARPHASPHDRSGGDPRGHRRPPDAWLDDAPPPRRRR